MNNKLFNLDLEWKRHIERLSEKAVEFIRREVGEGVVVVSFSGGKDSSVVLDLVRKSGVKYVTVFNFTTIEMPENVRFIRRYYPDVIWLKPRKSFYQYILEKGLPSMQRRWCCEKLKEEPFFRFMRENGYRLSISGIRKEESARRAKYGRVHEWKGIKRIYPIYDWASEEIWKYMELNELPVPEYYDYFPRNGCIPCPLMNKDRLIKTAKRYPSYFLKLREVYEKFYEKKVREGKNVLPFEECFRICYRVDWKELCFG